MSAELSPGSTQVVDGAPALRQIYFYLTQGCNQACRHCWISPRFDPHGDRYPTLPRALFERALQEALPLGLSRVKLTGGEPLLHPDILGLLHSVREHGLALGVETNGVLCTSEIAEALAAIPDLLVSVSIDGVDAATHDAVRGVPGSFDGAIAAVRRLVAAGVMPQLIMSLLPGNANQVADLVPMAEEIGASSVKFNVVQPTSRGERLRARGDTLELATILELGRQVEQEIAPSTQLDLLFDFPIAFRPLSRIAGSSTGGAACGIIGIMGVLATGAYAMCGIGEHVPELVYGRVGEDPLEAIWRDHPGLIALRDGLPDRLEGVCASCLMRGRCLGRCVAQNYYSNSNLWAPYWFCDEALQLGLFPSSRLGKKATLPSGDGGAGP